MAGNNQWNRTFQRVSLSCTQTKGYGWKMAILQDPYDIMAGVRLVGGKGWG